MAGVVLLTSEVEIGGDDENVGDDDGDGHDEDDGGLCERLQVDDQLGLLVVVAQDDHGGVSATEHGPATNTSMTLADRPTMDARSKTQSINAFLRITLRDYWICVHTSAILKYFCHINFF